MSLTCDELSNFLILNYAISETDVLLILTKCQRQLALRPLLNRNVEVCQFLLETLYQTTDDILHKIVWLCYSLRNSFLLLRDQVLCFRHWLLFNLNSSEVAELLSYFDKLKTSEEELKDLGKAVASAKDNVHDTEIQIKAEEMYNHQLLDVTVQFERRRIANLEAAQARESEEICQKIREENHNHVLSVQFLQDFLKTLEQQTLEWKAKYNRNTEMMKKEIALMTNKRVGYEENYQELVALKAKSRKKQAAAASASVNDALPEGKVDEKTAAPKPVQSKPVPKKTKPHK
ncbi:unnamed protein product [Notodromas monacha]|uniref:Uncharacterized protein n=1 Tax=Notodromas monacha TaxID=399045 RepID=A0A7R9BN42_9CRUS|nr:unnamed protein product [Notodromas monacha]CAG0918569.1 unnamed protein product [Notodromas monacha]